MKSSDSNRQQARLIFDSADLARRPGVRGNEVLDRHQMFMAEPYCLNLRTERDPRASSAVLIGQINGVGAYAKGLRDVTVDLAAAGRTIANAITNSLGEFQLEYEPEANMRLQLSLPDHGTVELPVDRRMAHRVEDARPDPYEVADWVWSR